MRAEALLVPAECIIRDKANEGTLTEAERAEFDKYRDAFHFVTILQTKASGLVDANVVA